MTLSSGTLARFTDLTQTRGGYPSVARQVADTTAGDARKSESYPAHIAACSTVGAVDGRDLSGLADSDLLMWATTAAEPITFGVGTTLYIEGCITAGDRIGMGVHDVAVFEGHQHLGGFGECIVC